MAWNRERASVTYEGLTLTRSSGTLTVKVTFSSQTASPRRFTDQFMIREDQLWRLHMLLQAVGVTGDYECSIESQPFIEHLLGGGIGDDLNGAEAVVTMRERVWNGKTFHNVELIEPVSG